MIAVVKAVDLAYVRTSLAITLASAQQDTTSVFRMAKKLAFLFDVQQAFPSCRMESC
jgi:hypothetical protein